MMGLSRRRSDTSATALALRVLSTTRVDMMTRGMLWDAQGAVARAATPEEANRVAHEFAREAARRVLHSRASPLEAEVVAVLTGMLRNDVADALRESGGNRKVALKILRGGPEAWSVQSREGRRR